MKIQLINGQFSKTDALAIITKMTEVKIKFQEEKIKNESNEEDVKSRERKIKFLQQQLFETRNYIETQTEIHLESEIFLNQN